MVWAGSAPLPKKLENNWSIWRRISVISRHGSQDANPLELIGRPKDVPGRRIRLPRCPSPRVIVSYLLPSVSWEFSRFLCPKGDAFHLASVPIAPRTADARRNYCRGD